MVLVYSGLKFMAFRKKNREINIFSMSALDLFASALGAFIIITIIVLPYYLKTDRTLKDKLNIAKQKLNIEKTKHQHTKKSLAKAKKSAQSNLKIVNLDIVFVLDVTGSMGDSIAGLRTHLTSIVRVLRKVSTTLNIGFVAFRDRRNIPVTSTFPLTNMTDQGQKRLLSFISNLRAGGGGGRNPDWPEAVEVGIRDAKNLQWRNKSKQIIIVIGDAPTSVQFRELSFRLAREFRSRHNSSLSAIYVDTFARSRNAAAFRKRYGPDVRGFFKKLAKAGGGDYVEDRGRMLESILLSVL